MKATGNGNPEQCAVNLLRITRGEVPYDRIKGRDAALVDMPSTSAAREAEADAEWLIETYEPRMKVESIDISSTLANVGEFGVNANITARKEEDAE